VPTPDHTQEPVQGIEDAAPSVADIARVRAAFDLIVPIADVAADLFYDRLFYLAPSLRRMFPGDMRDQKRKLIVMLAIAVQGLDDLSALVPQVKALGARHVGYGVTAAHYRLVGEVLIWTLERGLAGDFTPDVRRAWRRTYALLAGAMQEGAANLAIMRAAE
jgi:hemoglobin-like flavoprotein